MFICVCYVVCVHWNLLAYQFVRKKMCVKHIYVTFTIYLVIFWITATDKIRRAKEEQEIFDKTGRINED